EVARYLAEYDIGQTVVIAESACVAVEAMEGTDATIVRAGEIMRTLRHADERESFLSRALTVVKVAKPKQDLRFDVPVVGVKTIETMRASGATCLAVDAERCLFLDGDRVIEAADSSNIAILSS
ncbi:MAG: LpxI family protein, partial [Acidobacteria bacterium]|nr:LpxI family protein [Acidobacteriota bacterium]